jgi:hypothetical protein
LHRQTPKAMTGVKYRENDLPISNPTINPFKDGINGSFLSNFLLA